MTQAETRNRFIKAYPGTKRLGRKGYWYRCSHCGKWCCRPGRKNAYVPDDKKMEVDHIIPWTLGGSDNLYNLQALCRPCNRNKGAAPTFADKMKNIKNIFFHPIDCLLLPPFRRKARQNRILKKIGLARR